MAVAEAAVAAAGNSGKAMKQFDGFGLSFLLFAIVVALGSSAPAAQNITDFSSDIRIAANGTLTVQNPLSKSKTASSTAFPRFPDNLYRPRWKPRPRFDVDDVERDGRPEPYEIQNIDNGKRCASALRTHGLSWATYLSHRTKPIGRSDFPNMTSSIGT